ncbi:MAG: phosphotransferase [Tissierellales bacterium]|nr:phosphotransferase [Tissierellales bacterium]
MKDLLVDIPGSDSWSSIEFVNKGWSDDKKYHIVNNCGKHLLLRISDKECYEFKKKEHDIMKLVSKLDFDMTRVRDFGTCNQGIYMVLDWLEGKDLESVIGDFSIKEQYRLGYESGQILRKIHGIDVDIEPFSWEEKFGKKMDRKLSAYEKCPLKYENGDVFVNYINESRQLIVDRPIVFQHGDYHIGNMIYTKSGHVGIIDFGRFDFGDPWEEFNRIIWDAKSSPPFATGRIDGYFDGNVPNEFFDLLAIYIANNSISSLPWAIDFGDHEIEVMKRQAEEILDDFCNFEMSTPKWYDANLKLIYGRHS